MAGRPVFIFVEFIMERCLWPWTSRFYFFSWWSFVILTLSNRRNRRNRWMFVRVCTCIYLNLFPHFDTVWGHNLYLICCWNIWMGPWRWLCMSSEYVCIDVWLILKLNFVFDTEWCHILVRYGVLNLRVLLMFVGRNLTLMCCPNTLQ